MAQPQMTRTLLDRLDRAITAMNDRGFPTANLTDRFDELEHHLVKTGAAAPDPYGQPSEARKETA